MGDFVFIPKAIPHSYKSGQSGGKMLVISPAGLENYFKKVASAIQTGKITWELEKEIASRYGQQFLDKQTTAIQETRMYHLTYMIIVLPYTIIYPNILLT